MDKKYKKIDCVVGDTIDKAVSKLIICRENGELAYIDFNGTVLYSDTVTMDNAYKVLTGKTQSAFEKQREEYIETSEMLRKEHERKIPKLTIMWMEKGREILTRDKWDLWDTIIPSRLTDLYHGMELGNCLDIISILNNGGSLDEAKSLLESQGHSGMSYGLVCSMVKEFCVRGREFSDYVR